MSINRRQFLSLGAATTALAATSRFFVVESFAQDSETKYAGTFKQLDQFVETYMRTMNAPGMTLVMADRDGVQRVVTYGFSDIEQKIKVAPNELFEIGSISKSFIANCLLQLHQEGKLDFHKPLKEYLPWFPMETAFEPITIHHMLTHSSGLPEDVPVFLSDPAAKHKTGYAPGKNFHYSNLAFETLGHLLWTLDGRLLSEVIRKRVFEPLGMTQSEPLITMDMRARLAKSYSAFLNDRPYTRFGRLSEAAGLVFTDGAGCVASTPHDMGLYIQMIANHGQGPKSRLLSDESFGVFSTPHIKAEIFGPTASYGYGIAMDTLDGHKILRHTGGMASFASAIHVDIDQGVGAFASINAMQGYRPNPVAQYAMQLMRAQQEKKSAPAVPTVDPATKVDNAADYAGVYQRASGTMLQFVAQGSKLFVDYDGELFPMEAMSGDAFIGLHADLERFPIVFGRADAKDPKSPVVDVGWGDDWFSNSKYTGPKSFDHPKEWESYAGHYRNDNPWIGSMHINLRKGQLWLDGTTLLEPKGGSLFHVRDEDPSPEWIQFHDVVNGKAMRIKLSGQDLWRVLTP